jgi:hypothetical protein
MKVGKCKVIKNPSLGTWSVMLEWTGDKSQVLPLIEIIVRRQSDGSGCFLPIWLCDAQWYDLNRNAAWRIFGRLQRLSADVRFARYVRVSLFNHKRVMQRSVRGRCPKMPVLKGDA